MASKTQAQRIGIWIIVIALAVGTIASFFVVILMNQNDQSDQKIIANACTDYKGALQKQTDNLSAQYFATLSQHAGRVSAFDKAGVTELKTEDLVVGDGEEITAESSYHAYYIGWNPNGKIFDQSISGQSLKQPLSAVPGGLIQGWEEGVVGMKVGGIRELTIPSELAYGEQERSADIPANTPLKFIVMIIPPVEKVELPEALKEYEAYIMYYGVSYVCG